MARRSTTRRGVTRAFGYVLIPGAIVVLVIGAGAAIALVTVLPSFAATQSLETDLAPVSIAIADLNGDAKPDLATAPPTSLWRSATTTSAAPAPSPCS